ncbi:MAG: ROK family protein [Rhodobacteraceae bacterium]|nr:ROK family protein [Paracoccaceae bacterium]
MCNDRPQKPTGNAVQASAAQPKATTNQPGPTGRTSKRRAFALTNGCGPLLQANTGEAKPLRQQIFEHVRASGRAARADVARALGISAGSVTTLTSELIANEWLREVAGPVGAARGPRDTSRGRPPVALEVVTTGPLVAGLKLSDERHSAVLSDLAGNMIAEATLPGAPEAKPLDKMLDEIDLLLETLLKAAGVNRSRIAAIGIGLSGIIDHETGVVRWSPLLTIPGAKLRSAVEAHTGIATHIDNDANMLTLAELWFGAGRAKSGFIVVTIEGGVGMGMVMNNQLFRGTRGMGMEVGHTKVQLDGALCRCGRRGCLEAYLADYALAREASTALNYGTHNSHATHALLDELFAQAKAGNEAAQSIFRRAGRFLSLGLSNLIQIFDPELIILSGERMQYDYLYADEVLAEMQSLTLSDMRSPCRVEIHTWGDFVWARGASALALSAVTDAALGEPRHIGSAA